METFMSDKKEIIELAPLSEEQIAKDGIEYTELWMIKSKDGQMYGPFDTESIKSYAADNQDAFEDSMAYNLANETWKAFFKVAKFQRRKPKLVPMQSLMTSDNFIVLTNGEKKGPFSLEQIQKLVDDKKIALNVQVSLDDGESWIKLYEHHAFDRRLKKNAEDLPFVPENSIFEHKINTVKQQVSARSKAVDEEDALVGLAFISTGNDTGQKLEAVSNKEDEKISSLRKIPAISQEESQFSFLNDLKEKLNIKYVSTGIVTVLVLFTAINSFNSSFNNKSEIQKTNKAAKSSKASINNSARTAKTKVMPKSKPVKMARARKYQPKPQKTFRAPSRRPAQSRSRKRQIHRNERYEELDIDDPALKEELTRELAGDTYGDEYEELSDEQRDFIERANQEGFSDGDYEEMQKRDGQYDTVEDFE